VHREPAEEATAWTAGLVALAGERPVIIVDAAADPPGPAAPGDLVVVTAPLATMSTEARARTVEAIGAAAAVLLCAPPDDPGGVRAHPPETLPEWVALLAGEGLYRVVDADLAWLPSWGVLVERADLGPADLARRYERLVLPAAAQRPDRGPDAARVLSLTDRLIGLEAALAETNYRRDMAMLDRQEAILAQQDLSARLAAAESLVEAIRASASWRVGQRVVGPLRRAAGALPLRRRPR
jgi:hypothetical protein